MSVARIGPSRQRPRRAAVVIAALLLAGVAARAAAEFPERPIKLVVPFPPGGLVDIVARTVGTGVTARLGQPVVIENKPGAAGTIAADQVARAPNDGYTLLFGTSASLGIAKYVYKDLPYDPVADFAPVSVLGNVTVGVFASNPSGITDAADAVAKAKAGKASYSSPGVGSVSHLAGELFRSRAGIEMLHVPYNGNTPQMTDLVRGETQLAFTGLGSGLKFAQNGSVRLIAVAARTRSRSQPKVPALGELLPGYDAPAWIGIVAPKGTAPQVIARLESAVQEALGDPAVTTLFEAQGIDPESNGGARAFADKIRREMSLWEEAVKAAGAQPSNRPQ